jgi:hypothetical protein
MFVIGKILSNEDEENKTVNMVEVVTSSHDTLEQAILQMALLVENQSSDTNIVEFFHGVKRITGPNDSDYEIDVVSTVDKIL